MAIARNPRLKPLKAFAQQVGARIKVDYTGVGDGEYVLIDKDDEPVTRETDIGQMLDTLQAYYGGHENYTDALEEFRYAVNHLVAA